MSAKDDFEQYLDLLHNRDTNDENPTLFMGRGRYETLSGHVRQSQRIK